MSHLDRRSKTEWALLVWRTSVVAGLLAAAAFYHFLVAIYAMGAILIGVGYLAYANAWQVAFWQARAAYVFLYFLWNWEPPVAK